MATKHYENFTVFGARVYGMKHLWVPSTEYLGKKTDRPNYIAGFIVPKSRGHWSEEPVLAGAWGALQKVIAATPSLSALPYAAIDWPIRDGDIPAPGQKQAEWARGHWMFGGNSGDPVGVTIVQNGQPVPLSNRATVKPGDYASVGGAAAVKSNDPRGIKFYINSVLFMGPGEEIAVGNSVTGAELMAQAQAQGLHVAGFQPAGGFGGGGGGFPGGGGGGFTPPPGGHGNGAGFAPTQGGPAPAQFASPPNYGAPGGAPNGFASPSNPHGAPGFQPPPNGAPQGTPQYGAPGSMPAGGAQFPSHNGQPAQNGAFPSNPGQQQFPGAGGAPNPHGGPSWPQR